MRPKASIVPLTAPRPSDHRRPGREGCVSTCTDGLSPVAALAPAPGAPCVPGGQGTRVSTAGRNPGLAPLPPRLASGI